MRKAKLEQLVVLKVDFRRKSGDQLDLQQQPRYTATRSSHRSSTSTSEDTRAVNGDGAEDERTRRQGNGLLPAPA